MRSRHSSEMRSQDNFPFEARRSRNSGSRSGCVDGWRPAPWLGGSVGPGACPWPWYGGTAEQLFVR